MGVLQCVQGRGPEQVVGLGLAASGGQAPGRPAEGGPAPRALFSHGAKGCGHHVTKGPLLVTEQLLRASRVPPAPREPGGGPTGALCACGATVHTPSPTTHLTLLQAPALLPAVALNFSSKICKQEARAVKPGTQARSWAGLLCTFMGVCGGVFPRCYEPVCPGGQLSIPSVLLPMCREHSKQSGTKQTWSPTVP